MKHIPPARLGVTLPDFRNLGVLLRTLVFTLALLLGFFLCIHETPWQAIEIFVSSSPYIVSILLTVCLLLYLSSPTLLRIGYPIGVSVIVGGSLFVAESFLLLWPVVEGDPALPNPIRLGLAAALTSTAVLWYFNWRHRVLSPALTEARLIALQARIRPHFLFNSLNTVLGLMRTEPRRAETVLENLADLYRALLSDSGKLVPLAREIELARAYADIEATRLGERLKVNWQCEGLPAEVLVPPLILQPLIENAIYHGIEPSESGGAVDVTIFLKNRQLNIVVRNPCRAERSARSGNRMALENIRERLDLHYDAEAELSSYRAGDEFVVQMRMPSGHG